MARHDIRGTTPRDIYNINDNFIQLSKEIFGNSDFTKKMDKRITSAEGNINEILGRVDGLDGSYSEISLGLNNINLVVADKVGSAEFNLLSDEVSSKVTAAYVTNSINAVNQRGLNLVSNLPANWYSADPGQIETIDFYGIPIGGSLTIHSGTGFQCYFTVYYFDYDGVFLSENLGQLNDISNAETLPYVSGATKIKVSLSSPSGITVNEIANVLLKIEAGSIATSFSSYPPDEGVDLSDIYTRIETAEQKITPSAITSTVTQSTTYITDINGKEPNIHKQTTAPAHATGRLWLDTSLTPNVLKRSTGTAWVKVTPTTAGEVGAYSNANGTALAGRVSIAESSIIQNADNIALRVAKTDYNGNTIASLINQSATTITIAASKINLNGLVTANSNFKILTDGSMEAKNAKLTGEINTVDGSGRAVRVFNRNLAFYSPTNQSLRGILSSSKIPNETTEGLALLLPQNSSRPSYFSIATLDSYNDSTGVWSTVDSMLTARRMTNGEESITVFSNFFSPKAIQRGTILLNASSSKSVTFSNAMQGAPMVVLSPVHNITGAVITAKVVSTSTTGFSAIIQGSPTSQSVYFYWIAIS